MISETRLTVRYAETDMMGIMHHSRYYPWFEAARTEFIRYSGMSYTEMEREGIMLPLTETGCRYIQGLRYEDEAIVTCKLAKLSVARCEFAYKVYRLPERELVSEGRTAHGFVDRSFKPVNLKKSRPDIWEKIKALAEDDTIIR